MLAFKLPFKFSGNFPDKTLCLTNFFVANFVREPGWDCRAFARWKEPRAYRFEDVDHLLANASSKDVEDAISGHIVRDALDSYRSRTISLDLLQPESFLMSLKQAIFRAEWAITEFGAVSEWLNNVQKSGQLVHQAKQYTLAQQVQLWRLWELCFLRSEIHERQQRARRVFAKSILNSTSSWAKNMKICHRSAPLRTRIMALLTGKIISNESCEDFGKDLCNGSCTHEQVSDSDSSGDDDNE